MEPIRNGSDSLKRIIERSERIEIALKLRDIDGFYNCFFELLPGFKTEKECYTFLSEIYLEVFKTTLVISEI